jgi:hypothetical protein
MRIIKLSPADSDMKTRDDCVTYFTETIHHGYNYGKFGLTEAKSRMQGITRGVSLLFCYETELMFIARASGDIHFTSDWAYIPLKMGTLRPVSGSLRDLEQELTVRKLIDKNLVHAQQWPILSDECEPVVWAYIASPENPARALKLHAAMTDLYHTAGEKLGYWGKRYFQSVKRNGGFATAKRMLRPKPGGKIDPGLLKLLQFGWAHELSVEAIVQRPEFRRMFTEAELAEARRRLEMRVASPKPPADGPDTTHAGAVIDEAVNPGRGRKGQRYLRDAKARKAVEDRGMTVAEDFLRKRHFKTKNVCKKQSCDYFAYKNGREYIVEVKATTGAGDEVLITAPEVRLHRKRHPNNMLIVVHGIQLVRDGDEPKATGGTPELYDKWNPEDGDLTPMAYKWQTNAL